MDENTYCIRGITFKKDDLQIIPINDLKQYRFCPGHLYYFSSIHKKFIFMLQAGDLIEDSFINRYANAGLESFYILKFIHLDNVEKYKTHLNSIKLAEKENVRWVERNELIKLFKSCYIMKPHSSFLDVIVAIDSTFSKLDLSVYHEYSKLSEVLLKRAMICSSLSVLIAITVGFLDYGFLQDIYHVSFLKDYGLIGDSFNFSVLSACEQERISPGTGKDFFNDSEKLLNFFVSHPEMSFEKVHAKFIKIFNYPELTEAIRTHHELSDGTGFPKGLHYAAISDWESIISFSEYITPYQEITFSKLGDYQIKDLIADAKAKGILKNLSASRVISLFNAILNDMDNKEFEAIS